MENTREIEEQEEHACFRWKMKDNKGGYYFVTCNDVYHKEAIEYSIECWNGGKEWILNQVAKTSQKTENCPNYQKHIVPILQSLQGCECCGWYCVKEVLCTYNIDEKTKGKSGCCQANCESFWKTKEWERNEINKDEYYSIPKNRPKKGYENCPHFLNSLTEAEKKQNEENQVEKQTDLTKESLEEKITEMEEQLKKLKLQLEQISEKSELETKIIQPTDQPWKK